MTELTQESLESVLLDMAHMVNSRGETFTIRPTKLIIPSSVFRYLMWRPKIQKAKSIRKRKQAVSWRGRSMWQRIIAKS